MLRWLQFTRKIVARKNISRSFVNNHGYVKTNIPITPLPNRKEKSYPFYSLFIQKKNRIILGHFLQQLVLFWLAKVLFIFCVWQKIEGYLFSLLLLKRFYIDLCCVVIKMVLHVILYILYLRALKYTFQSTYNYTIIWKKVIWSRSIFFFKLTKYTHPNEPIHSRPVRSSISLKRCSQLDDFSVTLYGVIFRWITNPI